MATFKDLADEAESIRPSRLGNCFRTLQIQIIATMANFASKASHSVAVQEKQFSGEYIREAFLRLSLLEESADKTSRRRIKAIPSLEVLNYTSVEWQEMAERI